MNTMNSSKKVKIKKCFLIPVILVLVLLTVFFIGKRILFPPYTPLPASGNLTVAETTVTWTDESRTETFLNDGSKRWLNVDFYYPENAVEEGLTYPLVIFSHGAFGVSLSNYSTYTELASHGYIVASISHTYHAAYSKSTDGKMAIGSSDFIKEVYSTPADESGYHTQKSWMELRRADVNFVLDTILNKQQNGESFFAAIDREHIGIMGHSLGGATAVMIGRERPEIDAVIDLDGTMLGETIDFQDGKAVYLEDAYPLPLLNFYGEDHWNMAKELGKKGEKSSYINFFVDQNAVCGYHTVITDSGHMNFTDLPLISPILASKLGTGTIDSEKCLQQVNELVLSFFDCYLKGKGTFSVAENITL